MRGRHGEHDECPCLPIQRPSAIHTPGACWKNARHMAERRGLAVHAPGRMTVAKIGRAVVHIFIMPETCKSVGSHGRVADDMLNILMPQVILHGPGIMPLRREVIAARMP